MSVDAVTEVSVSEKNNSRRKALLISQCLALICWLVAFLLSRKGIIPVWYDQFSHFTQVGNHLSDPYALPRFVYPPWTALALIPFTNLPLPLAALLQICLYFALLTLVIHKFNGDWRTVLLVLTSYWAVDNALQINIEWLVCIGLLLPAAWGAPFLLMKPQVATGIWLSYKRSDVLCILLVSFALLALSLLIWGNWLPRIYTNLQNATIGQSFNIAPMVLLPIPVTLVLGLLCTWQAWRKRDPILSVIAGLFFVPYITFYSLLLPFALATIRLPRWALLISVLLWLVYGRFVILALIM